MKEEEIKYQFIGFHLNQKFASYLALFCFNFNLKKAELLRSIVHDWKCDTEKSTTSEFLINEVSKNIQTVWNISKLKNENKKEDYLEKSFEHYMRLTKLKLVKKGISDEDIESILNNLTL